MSERTGAAQKISVSRVQLPFFYGWVLVGVSFVTYRCVSTMSF
jgi:hypothetical protein